MSPFRQLLAPVLMALLTTVASVVAWYLHPMTFVVLLLSGSGSVGISTAMQFPGWTTLRPGLFHLIVWFLVGIPAAVLSVLVCLSYNEVAGTDKTPLHIAQISIAMFSGPMVGPVANPAAGESPSAVRATVVLLVIFLVGTSPFLIVRRAVSKPVAIVAWTGFLAVTVLWFFGALVSLGVFLS